MTIAGKMLLGVLMAAFAGYCFWTAARVSGGHVLSAHEQVSWPVWTGVVSLDLLVLTFVTWRR